MRHRLPITLALGLGLAASVWFACSGPAAGAKNVATQPAQTQPASSWPSFRGTNGDSHSADVPATLPASAKPLWQKKLIGRAYAGLSVADGKLLIHDHDKDKEDILHCLDANTGNEIWQKKYDNDDAGFDEWGSCPRAQPLIYKEMAFTLSARGSLIAWKLKDGEIAWQKELVGDFGGTMPNWGYCASPMMVKGNLIVAPGGNRASLVALDPKTGQTVWESPGEGPNYGSFLFTKVKNKEQIIAYDTHDVIGRDPDTGEKLWSHPLGHLPGPPAYLVPTPVVAADNLLLCVEDVGSRLLSLDEKHLAELSAVEDEEGKGKFDGDNGDFLIGDQSPTLLDTMALAVVANKGLMAVDLADKAKTLWTTGDKLISGDYGVILIGNGRALVLDNGGHLHLLTVDRKGAKEIAKMKVCEGNMPRIPAPALVGNRFYVRDESAVYCYDLAAPAK